MSKFLGFLQYQELPDQQNAASSGVDLNLPPDCGGCHHYTMKILKIWTPEKIAVITLKLEQGDFTVD